MLYLKDATWIDPVSFAMKTTDIAVEEGPFGGITLDANFPAVGERLSTDKLVDCKGKYVTRAFVNGHHHIYSALARGMPPAPKNPTNFVEVLEYIWWRLDKKLDLPMIEASALATGLYCAKNGVTFVIDHHASPFHLEGSLETIAKALDSLGLGHLLCYEMSCRDGEKIKEIGLAETDAYLSSGRKGHVGLHASFTVDDDLLGRAVALAKKHNTGLHIHVAEAASDQEHCMATYKKRIVQRLKDFGALDLPCTILGHVIHLDAAERAILEKSPCWIVQNAESNQNNNVGAGKYNAFPNTMFGTDGMHSDMIRSAQSAYFISGPAGDGMSPQMAYERLRGAHKHIDLHKAPGNTLNNLVVLDYDSPTPLHKDNFAGHFFYAMTAGHVHTVISQGRIIVEDRVLTSGNEKDILSYANEQAKRLWDLLK